jgi:hypothetical protein
MSKCTAKALGGVTREASRHKYLAVNAGECRTEVVVCCTLFTLIAIEAGEAERDSIYAG